LRALFVGQHLKIQRFTYAISITFPGVVVFRLLSKLRRKPAGEAKTHLIRIPRWINGLLTRILSFEAWLLKRVDLPFGLTLLVLAERTPEA